MAMSFDSLNSLLVSCGCCSKLPQTRLKATEIYSHTFGGQKTEIHITGVKSRCRQGCVSSGSSNFLPLPALVDASICWLVAASPNLCHCGHIAFCSSVCVKSPSFL